MFITPRARKRQSVLSGRVQKPAPGSRRPPGLIGSSPQLPPAHTPSHTGLRWSGALMSPRRAGTAWGPGCQLPQQKGGPQWVRGSRGFCARPLLSQAYGGHVWEKVCSCQSPASLGLLPAPQIPCTPSPACVSPLQSPMGQCHL